MPHKLNLMLSRKLADSKKGDDFIGIDAISDFLETELSARESVEMTSMTSSMSLSGSSSDKPSGSGKSQGHKSVYGPQKGKSKPKRGRATGLALVGTRARICGFCQGGHWSDHCQKVKGLKQRKDHCAENKLCYICLKPGHFSNNCRNDKPCYYCQKKGHNQALCNEDDKKNGKRDASKRGKTSKGVGILYQVRIQIRLSMQRSIVTR